MFKIELTNNVIKFLLKRNLKERIKIDKALTELSKNPYKNNLDIKKLQGKKDCYRLRIQTYRFIYRILKDKLLIFIYKADKRENIYKK